MDIEKVELKFTAAREDEGRVLDFLAAHPPAHRTVFFYDTPELALKGKHLFLRGRVTEGAGESTVKLRPVTERDATAAKNDSDEVKIELDVVGDKRDAVGEARPRAGGPGRDRGGDTDELFSKDQRKLIKRVAGDGALERAWRRSARSPRASGRSRPPRIPVQARRRGVVDPRRALHRALGQGQAGQGRRGTRGVPRVPRRPREGRRGRSVAQDRAHAQALSRGPDLTQSACGPRKEMFG